MAATKGATEAAGAKVAVELEAAVEAAAKEWGHFLAAAEEAEGGGSSRQQTLEGSSDTY